RAHGTAERVGVEVRRRAVPVAVRRRAAGAVNSGAVDIPEEGAVRGIEDGQLGGDLEGDVCDFGADAVDGAERPAAVDLPAVGGARRADVESVVRGPVLPGLDDLGDVEVDDGRVSDRTGLVIGRLDEAVGNQLIDGRERRV